MFREAFQKATGKRKNKIKIPDFELLEIEDYYTYYVLLLEVPENIFWHADLSFLLGVVENKTAYDNWLNYAIEK